MIWIEQQEVSRAVNYMGHLCREVYENARFTQRELAAKLGISLGKCNGLVRTALQQGLICQQGGSYALAQKGQALLQGMRVRAAIIMVAGIDQRFVPSAQDMPKSLLRVRGQRIVERTIIQLLEKGIRDITLIVGFMAERFEYLVDRFGVKLAYNPDYATQVNLGSLYLVRHLMGQTYLVNGDYWLEDNLFHEFEPETWIACHEHAGPSAEVCVETDAKRRIRGMQLGGIDMLVKRGPVYVDEAFAHLLRPVIEKGMQDPGLATGRWENVLQGKFDDLPIYANLVHPGAVLDFASYEDMREFDLNAGSAAMREAIARLMQTQPDKIQQVRWHATTTASQVFRFSCGGGEYVYRIPGAPTERFTTYKQEAAVYKALAHIAVTDDMLEMDGLTGEKTARYFVAAKEYHTPREPEDMAELLGLLRRLHQSNAHVRHHFTIRDQLRHYHALCKKDNCVHFEDYENTYAAVRAIADEIAKSTAPLVLCHVNVLSRDLLRAPDGTLRFGGWECSGMCHAAADIAFQALHMDYSPEKLDPLLKEYLGRKPLPEELHLCRCYAAAGALLWCLWAEYRQCLGEAYGGQAVRMYQLCKQHLRAIE